MRCWFRTPTLTTFTGRRCARLRGSRDARPANGRRSSCPGMFATWSATWAMGASLNWTGGRAFSSAKWRLRTFHRATGAHALCAIRTADLVDTSCVQANIRFITPVTRRTSMASARSASASSRRSRCFPSGLIIPIRFAVHTSPEDAIQAFLDLDARWMVPMHYGTFRLSYEPVDEPVERLKADAKRSGIERKICVMEEGVTKFFE